MKKISCLIFLLCAIRSAHAQAYDTVYATQQLKEVDVRAHWLNDTDRYHYNQMRYYVTTILPYLNAATQLFTEINNKLNDPSVSKAERKRFIKLKDEEMRTKFEDKVGALNVTQGVLLMKLVARQTDMNIYKMLSDFKNPFVAIKWQTWARLNGMNINQKYHPEDEPDLENIMESLGYPLPLAYTLSAR